MYEKIKQKVSENKDMILIGTIVVLTISVIRSRPTFVQDVMLSESPQQLIVEFSNGSSNAYSLTR